MPITFEVDHEHHLVRTVATGPITYAEVERHLFQEHEARALGFPELIDAHAAIPKLSAADVRQIVGLLRGLSRNATLGRTAIIVPSEFAAGLMLMIAMLMEDIFPLRTFRDTASAEAWLAS